MMHLLTIGDFIAKVLLQSKGMNHTGGGKGFIRERLRSNLIEESQTAH